MIPISVGQQPRQLAFGDGVVYVTNYSSSDLYTIDEKRSRVIGDPLWLSVEPVLARASTAPATRCGSAASPRTS